MGHAGGKPPHGRESLGSGRRLDGMLEAIARAAKLGFRKPDSRFKLFLTLAKLPGHSLERSYQRADFIVTQSHVGGQSRVEIAASQRSGCLAQLANRTGDVIGPKSTTGPRSPAAVSMTATQMFHQSLWDGANASA